MGNLNEVIESIVGRNVELQSYLCQLVHDITPEVTVETMNIPISTEEIHYTTIIGANRVPVVSLTIYIPREVILEAVTSGKVLKVNTIISIEETCPDIYREPLEKALDLDRRDKKNI